MQPTPSPRLNPLAVIYLILMAGAAGLTTFVWDAINLTPSGASVLFFGLMGLFSLGFYLRGEGRPFATLAKVWSALAFLSLVSHIFLVTQLSSALAVACFSFLLAGGSYFAYRRRRAAAALPASQPVQGWRELGPRSQSLEDQQLNPAQSAAKSEVRR